MKKSAKSTVLCAFFSALIIVGAYIRIPIPPVPITLQTFFVILSGFVIGARCGMISVLVYIVLGLVGLPVFAGGAGGIGYVLTPTFGYLLGFAAAACIAGSCRANTYKGLLAAAASMLAIYLCGGAYYILIQTAYLKAELDLAAFILSFFVLTLPKDIGICFLCAFCAKRLRKATKSLNIRG